MFFIFLFSTELFSISLRGRLYSRKKDKPEANVTGVILDNSIGFRKGFVTDDNGYFDIDVPQAGTYTFRVIGATGFKNYEKSVSTDGELITIYTDKKDAPKGAIQVDGEKEKTILSRYKVRYDEIKRMPGTLGEALNALQTLPGIFAPPFFGGGGGQPGSIVIRGANPAWNTYLYDDLPILYPYHFDSINSVIHNDLIKTIDIYTGAFPAHYSDATGGVIEIESTDRVDKTTGSFNISLLLSQAMFQTPLFGGKGYLAVGGKVGYLDKTIGATGLIPEGIRLPQYTSSNVKFGYSFNNEHSITFTNLTASDNFVLNAPNKYNNDPTKDPFAAVAGANVSVGQGFRTTAFRHIWTPGDKLTNRLTLINFDPYRKTDVSFGSIEADYVSRGPYTALRQDATWKALDFLKIDFGTQYRYYSYNISGFGVALSDPNNLSPNPYDTITPDFEKRDVTEKTRFKYGNAYTTFHFVYKNFKFEPAIRYDYISTTKEVVPGPRGTISYKQEGFLKGTTFFGGAGDYYRYPFFTSANSKESGNPYIKFEKARKYGGGIDQQLAEEWSLKGEVFKQEFSNLIVQDNYVSEFIGLNPDKGQWATNPVVYNRPLNYSNSGNGWSRGYEVYLKKSNRPNSKDWFGWVSYTWSQTFRNTNTYSAVTDSDRAAVLSASQQRIRALYPNSKETIYDFDVTHLLNVVFGWRFSQEYQVGGRWFYRTSFPITPVIGDDGGQFSNPANGQIYWAPKYSTNPYGNDYVNSRRIKPYHRLDIRLDRFVNYEWGYINWYIEIINIYMRDNELGESFNSTRPYSRTNPSPQYDFFVLRNGGRKSPFFNVGLEVRF
ncbi:MAG: TonB-dependent receptor [Leptospiraceae bacterium]|nr:TonB-dependent receptor [Leptospiraceae bacterium]